MLRCFTYKSFAEIRAFKQLEPFAQQRADYRAASIVQMIFNMAVDVKNRKQLKDFVLKFGEQPEKKQAPQQQWALLKLLAAAYSSAEK